MEAALDRHKEKLAAVEVSKRQSEGKYSPYTQVAFLVPQAKKRDVESHRERCLDATAEAEGAMSELTAERESLVRAVSRAEREAAAADRDMNELARDRMRKAAEVGALTERYAVRTPGTYGFLPRYLINDQVSLLRGQAAKDSLHPVEVDGYQVPASGHGRLRGTQGRAGRGTARRRRRLAEGQGQPPGRSEHCPQ